MQVLNQTHQAVNLHVWILFLRGLFFTVIPVWVASPVYQFYANGLFVVVFNVVRDAIDCNPLMNAAITINIKVSRITCATVIQHFFTVASGHCQVRQFGAMHHHQADGVSVSWV